ncbi:MAG: hypothetical protein CV087_10090 [Candidatus Brocadia sp. WS118]|nr:MAG: hypothetical protein CV087_10090 [Candidatus Brocadia sp. WS118]
MNPDFKEFIRLAKKILPKRTSLSCLSYAAIEDGTIRVTDLETTLVFSLLKENYVGKFLLPFDLLERLTRLKAFNDFPLRLAADRIEAAGRVFELDNTVRPGWEEFSVLPDIEFKAVDTWKLPFLKRLKSQRAYLGSDMFRPAFHNIQVQSTAGLVKTSACDGYRLMRITHPESPETEYQFLLPPKIQEMLEKASAEVSVSLASSDAGGEERKNDFACFRFGNFALFARLPEESYPDVEAVIDPKVKGSITFNRIEVFEYLKEALLIIPDKFTAAHFDVGEDQFELTVWVNANSVSGEIVKLQESFWGDHQGCNFSISFNARYLAEVLRSVSTEKITLGYRRWDRGAYIRMPEETEASIEIMLMPLREIEGLTPKYPHTEAVAVTE